MERQAKLFSHLTMPSSHPALQKPHFISFQATLQQFFYTQQTLPHRNFYTQKPEALAHRSFFHKEILDKDDFTHSNALLPAFFFTQQTLTQRHFYTQKLLHKETQTHTKRFFYTEKLVSGVFAHRSFCTQKLFTDRTFYTEAFTQRSFYTEKNCTQQIFAQRSFYAEKLLHTEALTQNRFYTRLRQQLQVQNRISTSKPKKTRF